MAITNNAAPGSQIRLLCMIDRVLNRRGGKTISKLDLIELLRPEMLSVIDGARKRLPSEVSFWAKEGLWNADESGLSQQSPLSSERNLPARVLRTLIHNEKTIPLLTGTRGQPLLMCVTSMLAQDKYTLRGGKQLTKEAVPMAVGPMINDKMAGIGRRNLNVTNEADPFLNYAYFLGFTEPYLEGWVMDPTRAILGVLDDIPLTAEMPVQAFLSQLAEHLPMLDGGVYRQQVEPMIAASHWQPLENHLLSASLSQALHRLEQTMQLVLGTRSDDLDAMVLQSLEENGVPRRISTVSPGEARK